MAEVTGPKMNRNTRIALMAALGIVAAIIAALLSGTFDGVLKQALGPDGPAPAESDVVATPVAPDGQPVDNAAVTERIVPVFDLVRVEPSGDAVIVGKGAPNTDVEILSGSDVIARGEANEVGDWVVVLDEPLPAGSHDIKVRSRTDDGAELVSEQSASVSVPEGGDGEVLVVLNRPGEASEVVQLPPASGDTVADAAPAAGTTPAADTAAASGTTPPADAAATTPPAPATVAEAPATPAPDSAATEPPPAEAASGTDAPAGETEVATADAAPAASSAGQPATAEASAAAGSPTPAPDAPAAAAGASQTADASPTPDTPPAAAGTAAADASAADDAADAVAAVDAADAAAAATPGDMASVAADPSGAGDPADMSSIPAADAGTAAPATATDAGQPATVPATETEVAAVAPAAMPAQAVQVSVEAVELENGRRFFAAGAAEAGAAVRVYVNDELAAETQAMPTGRWLVDAEVPLDPGQHRVRVDQVGPDGQVLSRAEVPFEILEELAAAPTGVSGSGTVGAGSGIAGEARVGDAQTLIIRRGDNLWRIARRLYGAGVRYSTIYQANTDQIGNPNLIYPGQVFVIPQGDRNWEESQPVVQ